MILDCMEMAVDHNLGKMILYDPEFVTACVFVFPHIISSLWLWECDYCFTKIINIQFIEMYSGKKKEKKKECDGTNCMV